jgi:hypothetical protein
MALYMDYNVYVMLGRVKTKTITFGSTHWSTWQHISYKPNTRHFANVPHATFPVVPLVVKPVGQAVQEVASVTGRDSGAKVSTGQPTVAVPFQ